jgi:hypothetical protein
MPVLGWGVDIDSYWVEYRTFEGLERQDRLHCQVEDLLEGSRWSIEMWLSWRFDSLL